MRQHQKCRKRRDTSNQKADQFAGCRISPVNILQYRKHGPSLRERYDPTQQGLQQALALPSRIYDRRRVRILGATPGKPAIRRTSSEAWKLQPNSVPSLSNLAADVSSCLKPAARSSQR